jgi:Regulator of ribonuclease activity B
MESETVPRYGRRVFRRQPKRSKTTRLAEIDVPSGLAYALHTHSHQFGSVVHVLRGVHPSRPRDIHAVIRQPVQFTALFTLEAAIDQGHVRIIDELETPSDLRDFPIFRSGVPSPADGRFEWWLWDGRRERKLPELSAEHAKLPTAGMVNYPLLVERIESDWTPTDYPSAGPEPDDLPSLGGPVDHYVFFDTEAEARGAERELEVASFDVEVQPAPTGKRWMLRARDEDSSRLDETRLRLERIAAARHGEYDGWEAPANT